MKTQLQTLTLAALLVIPTQSIRAAVYSFADDFRVAPNQANAATNTWQYFYNVDIANRAGTYTRLESYSANIGSQGFPAWNPSGSANYPCVGRNTSSNIVQGVQPGEGVIVPSAITGIAIGFQAPTNGYYDISGRLHLSYLGNNGVRWFLDKGSDQSALTSGTLAPGEVNNFFFQFVHMSAGEFLYLVFEGNGNGNADWTAVDFQVSTSVSALSLVLAPALRVGGTPGRTYRVEYIDQFAPTNSWTTLTTVTSTGPSQLIVDPALLSLPKRFYRTVELP